MQDANEVGVANVALTLNGTSFDGSTLTRSYATDGSGDGRYTFGDLPPGNYTVSITVPRGFVLTTPGPGTSTDSDFSPSTKSTGIITLAAGQSLPSMDAGLVQLGE